MSANDELQAHTCEKMLEFYGNVANNVAQPEMQDLTKKWKNGEFEEGDYFYVKTKMGDIFTDCIDYDRPHWDGFKNDVEEILAPVPTYDEWVYLHKARNDAHEIVENLTQENQQLKELLYSLKCCLISENIEPQIRVEKSLAKIEEFLTDGK